ncbi:pilus assembly protein [Vibrio chagasii]|uniref:TadE/TadG family type IV pilus assembly protein n=1 Tax=Vibrio chagasii TaxID=170679 RepID=UPI001EFE62EB|nr:TadE/TadG family type IV pilus assembly protein [Vibrio chagasii]MCG9673180.1 pilus assembly protein [Vibrio chagasii]CAH7113492.1 Protein TadG, associated with Flp pilus assembly [Vibrio chagasii]
MKIHHERHINRQYLSLQRQQGVAAVWMGLLLVPIMGMTFWAVEGTRYVQETSRLRDSAEAAAIAVTIEDQPDLARGLATQYVENYVRDIKSTNLSAQRFHQAEDEGAGILEYIQYTVNAKTTHDSWFASSFIPSFDEQQDLAGRSLARKYPVYLGDNSIDIVFVSDFSGSMDDRWGSSRHKKIDDLKTAIDQISSKILCTSTDLEYVDGEWKEVCDEPGEDTTGDKLLNRVGFVPFNVRTREIVSGGRANATSQLSYKPNYKPNVSPYSYNDVNWDYWRAYSQNEVLNCANWQSYCPSPKSDNQKYAKRIKDVIYLDNYHVADVYNYVDLSTSVATMFTDKSGLRPNFYGVNGTDLFNAHGSSSSTQFKNLRLSNKLSDLNPISSMWADGGTAAFQGILRGSQILKDGDPNSSDDEEQQAYNKKIKMLLILSDGQESPNNGILKGLVDRGMCDKAREEIPGLYIGVIGIDFRASQQSGFQDCVIDPNEDIIDVSNLDELIEKIEELIRKGSKTSGITKLY